MLDLTDRVAVVTGSSRGIGRAIALKLASLGAKVVVNYYGSEDAAEEVVEEIKSGGGEAIAVQADVKDSEQAKELIGAALEAFGRLDILVNNVGITRDTLLMRMKEDDWDIVMNTNLKGTFNCTKAAQRTMIKQRYGRIINITSVSGIAGQVGQANYSASKAGVIGFTKAVARELGTRNITANAVAPGYVPTDQTADLPQELIDYILELTPLKRPGTAEEIANAVAFLASEEASYVSGQVLGVDGGMMSMML
ncbi:MAG: 3-oxoacyl-[acyl-carrier-protein] reductase [Anaerolineae bacterium]|nr:3-oxoacyl-[acyl-carrier-protein] reductase [Anaerolineae bacterium]NIN94061.1 3-oxoacyl-[acyl-carrier-protein] reductase [Anaerolineae bacterium]NIQ77102.1 3-oxoacyl-[acyl-carrier-protein] reductase [Anaerolineae bacterium]